MLNITNEQQETIDFLKSLGSNNSTKIIKVVVENIVQLQNKGWILSDLCELVKKELKLDVKYDNFTKIIRNYKKTKETTKAEEVETPKKKADVVKNETKDTDGDLMSQLAKDYQNK